MATATKALQDQLAEKDLPQVERRAGLCRWTSPCSKDGAITSAASGWRRWGREGSSPSWGIPPEGPATGAGPGRRTGRGPGPRNGWGRGPQTARGVQSGTADRTQRRPRASSTRCVPLLAWSQTTERRPGRPGLRAERPGLGHGERRPPGVPGMFQPPLGGPVLRRGRPGAGFAGRRGGGEHLPLRRPPGQRRGPRSPTTMPSASTRPTSSRR